MGIYGIIYKITNIRNGKVYIGQTTQTRGFKGRYDCKGEGIERVFNYYIQRRASGDNFNEYLFNAIKKYGKKNFRVDEEIDIAYSKEELDAKEINYIKKYDSFNGGYNLNEGGGGNKGNCKGGNHYLARKVICVNTNKVFESVADAEREYRVRGIYNCLRNKRNCAGAHPETKEKFIWMYLEEFITSTREEILMKIKKSEYSMSGENHPNAKGVVCLNDDERYGSISEAEKAYGFKVGKSKISEVCNYDDNMNEKRYSVKHPETKERLVFMYLDDYLVATPNEVADRLGIDKRWVANNIAVVCLNTGEIFKQIKEAEKFYGVGHIGAVCRGKRNYAGIHPKTNERLVWRFIDDYESLTKEKINDIINSVTNVKSVGIKEKVVCLNTNEEFASMKEAIKKYKDASNISACCNSKHYYAGRHPKTGEPLVWVYKKCFVKLAKEEIESKIERAKRKLSGANHPRSKKVILINNGEEFDSIEEARGKFKMKLKIRECCIGERKTTGKHSITGERYVWMFFEDWNEVKDMKLTYEEILEWKRNKYQKQG